MKLEINFYKSNFALARGSLIVDETFVITFTIRQSKRGAAFVSYPSYKKQDGTYKNTAYSLKKDINTAILTKYGEWRRNQPSETQSQQNLTDVDISDSVQII